MNFVKDSSNGSFVVTMGASAYESYTCNPEKEQSTQGATYSRTKHQLGACCFSSSPA